MDQPQNVNIKIPDEVLKGVYANMMMVTHSKEEFVLDFINMLPPTGVVNARVITSPSHLKRIVKALSENIAKYESQFGIIKEESGPANTSVPTSTSEKQFGFESK